MLQRRKRYKNRTILGYKTLAAGAINMAEVRWLAPGAAWSVCSGWAWDAVKLKSPGEETGSMSKQSQPFLTQLSGCPGLTHLAWHPSGWFGGGSAGTVVPGCGAPAPTGLCELQALGPLSWGCVRAI